MTFSFNAVGTKQAVIRQVRAHNLDNSGSLATTARTLIVEALEQDEAPDFDGYEFAYIVKASGHSGGGSPVSLTLTIEAQWVPDVREVAQEAAAEESADETKAAI